MSTRFTCANGGIGVSATINLAIDVALIGVSPFLALAIRDNLSLSLERFAALTPYAILCMVVAGLLFHVSGLNRTLWRYTSIADAFRVLKVTLGTLLITLAVGFALFRLEGVPRSLPLLQEVLNVALLCGARLAVRYAAQGADDVVPSVASGHARHENVLIVGVGPMTEVCILSIEQMREQPRTIIGLLDDDPVLDGRYVRGHKVLASPVQIKNVLASLKVHGVAVDRVYVCPRFAKLRPESREALLTAAAEEGLLIERFGDQLLDALPHRPGAPARLAVLPDAREVAPAAGLYWSAKRTLDVLGALLLTLVALPIVPFVWAAILVKLGPPVVFWQERPGRFGQPFRVYKFRTMRPPIDRKGAPVSEPERLSRLGRFLRRSRLDEIPQLCNILYGDMSFVGPRPLLPHDQPPDSAARLLVRPGLTGWAQVNGGRDVSIEEKNALDIWYLTNASLKLDAQILLRTLRTIVFGEQRNPEAIRQACQGAESATRTLGGEGLPKAPTAPGPAPCALEPCARRRPARGAYHKVRRKARERKGQF